MASSGPGFSTTDATGSAVAAARRVAAVRSGARLELVTVVWMGVEAVLAIGAGIAARSVLLTAFGFDSVIELLSGAILLWRLSSEARGSSVAHLEGVERRATVISAALLALLCAYLVFVGLGGILLQLHPSGSVLGVAVSTVAVIAMPALAWRKRRVNLVLGSPALRADIAETVTCAYMAAATLAGAVLNLAFGWWWAEYAAALALLVFVVLEAREAIEAARGGEAH
jgi:divalent metal cation (Fe/Co/Zn/Cd) transporter